MHTKYYIVIYFVGFARINWNWNCIVEYYYYNKILRIYISVLFFFTTKYNNYNTNAICNLYDCFVIIYVITKTSHTSTVYYIYCVTVFFKFIVFHHLIYFHIILENITNRKSIINNSATYRVNDISKSERHFEVYLKNI